VEAFSAAIRLAPESPLFYFSRGQMYLRHLNLPDQARADFQQGCALGHPLCCQELEGMTGGGPKNPGAKEVMFFRALSSQFWHFDGGGYFMQIRKMRLLKVFSILFLFMFLAWTIPSEALARRGGGMSGGGSFGSRGSRSMTRCGPIPRPRARGSALDSGPAGVPLCHFPPGP
jgi:hypothetical protein